MVESTGVATTLDPGVRERLTVLLERGELPLPVLPEAAAQLLVLVQRPDTDIRAVAEVIRRDPALTAHVLRLAGSPVYGAATKVVSLQQVIGRLGFSTILQIALVVASKSRVFQVAGFETEVREAFRHSFATALFAQEIARLQRSPVETAFIAGLLHDIGRPLLLQTMVDLHRRLGIGFEPGVLLAATDEAHAEVGGALATRWAIAPQVAEAIRKHHAPEGVALASVVALADALAHGVDGTVHAVASNLYPEDVAAIAARSADIMQTVEALA